MKNNTLLALAWSLILPAAAAAQGSAIIHIETVVPERGNPTIPTMTSQVTGTSALEADFDPEPMTQCDPMTVTFTDRSTGGTPVAWEWDVNGDGTVDGTTSTFTYTYHTPGNYRVGLTVRDGSGASASKWKEPYVVLPAIVPNAGPDTTICSGMEVQIGFELEPGSGDPIIEWEPELYLSDPRSPNPLAFPEETITYQVKVNNVGGCSTYDTITITVNPLPAFPDITRSGNTLTSSTEGSNYRWTMNGNVVAEGANFKSYTPTVNGSYSVQVFNTFGCSNTSQPINFVLESSTSVDRELAAMDIRLSPNPFDERTMLQYNLLKSTKVRVTLHNLLGQEVAVLADETQPAGPRSISIDGASLVPGIYVCRMQIGGASHEVNVVRVR